MTLEKNFYWRNAHLSTIHNFTMATALSTPLYNDDEKGGYYIDFEKKIAKYAAYPEDEFYGVNNGTVHLIKPEDVPEVIRNDVIGDSVFEYIPGKENYCDINTYCSLTKVFNFVEKEDHVFIDVKSLSELYQSIAETEEEMKTLDKQFVEDMMRHSLFCVDSVGRVNSHVYDDDVSGGFSDWRLSKSNEPVFNESSISHFGERSRNLTEDYMGMIQDLRAFIQLAQTLIYSLK